MGVAVKTGAQQVSWRDEAACLDSPVEWFFGMPYGKAVRTCQQCPVTDACFRYALGLRRSGEPVRGVWGGRVFTQRKS